MTEDTINIPDSLPNLAAFYERAVSKFFLDPLSRWTASEKKYIGDALGQYAGRNVHRYGNEKHMELLEIPTVETILRDIDELNLPKYVCLLKWLAPEGIAHQSPTLLSEIAKRFLS